MNGDAFLLLRLLAAQAVLLAALALLARGLGRRLRAEVFAAAVAVPALLLAPWLAGDRILLPTGNLRGGIPGIAGRYAPDPYARALNDVSLLLAPWEIDVRRELAAGRLPLWSDLRDGGSSPWADPQVAVLAPTSMLARLLPVRHHFLAALALKIGVALAGAWVLARALGARRPAALLAATAFAAGGGILAWGLFPHSSVAAFAPWCAAAALGVARRADRRSVVAAALAFTALLLSGQPEVAFGVGLLAGAFALAYGRRRRRLRGIARLAAAVALASALAAPVVLPFLAVVGDSQRAFDRARESSRVDARRERPAPRLLLAPLSPWAAGVPYAQPKPHPAASVYAFSACTGLLALAGAAVALADPVRRRRAAPPVGLAIVLIAVGARLPPLSWIWARLPPLDLQEPSNLLPLAALCLTLAAALGLDRLLRARRAGVARRVAMVVAVAAAVSWSVAPVPVVLALGLAAVLAALLAQRLPRLALATLAIAGLVDQVGWGRHLLPPGDPEEFYRRTADVEALVRAAGGPGGRAVGHDRLVYPALLSTWELSDPRPHNPLASRHYVEVLSAAFGYAPDLWHYFGIFRRPEHPLLDFLGVRVVLTNAFLPAIPGMQRRPLSNPYFHLAFNREALPRQFLATRFDRVEREEIGDWVARLEDPRRVALFADEADGALPAGPFRSGRVKVLSARPGEIALRVPSAGAKLLATSHRGPGGWSARSIDGAALRTLTVNGAFLGVAVPPGVGRLTLSYRPPGFAPGLLLAGAGVLALAALGRPGRRSARAA